MLNDYVSYNNDDEFKKILEDIFTDEFMQEYTNLENFEAFKYSSAVMCTWDSPRLVYSKTLLDGFVRESSRFDTWDEMVVAATDLRFGKK
ncbi:hypothetical protein BHK98_06345 [Hornefia porci]|uniref:Uncharacterized protein n=1 Tax=Hornefia porci TaxID=2652292 RepID=A0A1Q9JHM9_9FIRM|nr:hypothetical protein [Hornefia porci]OLR55718.1 hypothetical protein BHK98_06345 [Hornefia porci]